MSFWLYTRGEGGKHHLWQIDTEPFAVMSVLAFAAVVVGVGLILHPALTGWLSVVLLLSGLACLILAKVSLYRQGIWLSFGAGRMTSHRSRGTGHRKITPHGVTTSAVSGDDSWQYETS